MGYRTSFRGHYAIDPPLSADHQAYLEAFSQARHMARDWMALVGLDDPLRQAVGLPIGFEGAYFVGDAHIDAPLRHRAIGTLSTQHSPGSIRVGWITDPKPLTKMETTILREGGKVWYLEHGYTEIGDQCTKRHNHPSSSNCSRGFTSMGDVDPQPGLWCQWVPANPSTLKWDGEPEFYHAEQWLTYLISNFFGPWGYMIDGAVSYQGDDPEDVGVILVQENVVAVAKAREEDE